MVLFGMALTIPQHESKLCKQLDWPAWAAVTVSNDLVSWEKERDRAKRSNEPLVMSSVSFLMRQRSLTEAEAKKICRSKIQEYVTKYLQNVESAKRDPHVSSELRTYLEAVTYSISGNLVWSFYSPRYQPEVSA